MPVTHDGQTLSDYTVTSGYVPTAYVSSYDAAYSSYLSELLTLQKNASEAFSAIVGRSYGRRQNLGAKGQGTTRAMLRLAMVNTLSGQIEETKKIARETAKANAEANK
jgi:hypothetical protein